MTVDWRARDLPDGVEHRLVLMRHGEPVPSARGRCYGRLDVALSSSGREQVRRVVEYLAEIPFAAVYSSPRVRASESAHLLADATGAPLRIEPRLSEMDFGELEGRRYDDVERTMPEFFSEWMRNPTGVQFPGGESFAGLQERACEAVGEIKGRHAGEVVAAVAHGGVIRAVLARNLGLDPTSIFRIDQSYAALTCVDYYGNTPVVRVVNWLP